MTECTQALFPFEGVGQREVVSRFDGGHVVSDGGALLLRQVEHRTDILRRLAACFTDQRDPRRVEHSVEQLVKQRVYGLALGYEDLNDHEKLRRDPLLARISHKGCTTPLVVRPKLLAENNLQVRQQAARH